MNFRPRVPKARFGRASRRSTRGRTVDPFGQATTVTLEPAELFAGQSVDPLGNTVTATFDLA